MPRYRRFQDASVSEKILDTMFLLMVGIGYLFAMLHLYFTHEGRDGKPGLSVQDVAIAYYGTPHQTRLGVAVNGPMAANLPRPADKAAILDWIQQGADEARYEQNIAPILKQNCIGCHSKESGLNIPPLTSYGEVSALTQADTGATWKSLVRVSHIHLFGIAFLLFCVGRIFILCEMAVWLKRFAVAIPFIAVILDILSWFLTKIYPGFAYLVVGGGALMGVSFAAQILVSLYQMWFYKPEVVPVEM